MSATEPARVVGVLCPPAGWQSHRGSNQSGTAEAHRRKKGLGSSLGNRAIDPDTIHILSGALEDAWRVVKANKPAFKIDGNGDDARQMLAKHIVDMAKQGERDRQHLIEGALTQLKS
jgi:hypothetical protein